ncbi:hypothetical protein AALM99_04375 [Lactococcus muris]|uniref:Uncharacterized protein n=1 Tax=Lactococcus muris TaxID=2941330 RepID=A0ABV4D8R3_9LACT
MDNRTDFENKIIDEIKNLIISDSSLTYGERNTFDRFILKIDKGEDFEKKVGALIRNLHRLDNGEIQEEGLSFNAKKIYSKLVNVYGIPKKDEVHIYYNGGYRRLTNRQWFWMMLFFIVFVFLMFTGKLNFILDFINKYLD